MKKYHIFTPLLTLVLLLALTGMKNLSDPENQKKKYHYFEDPAICSGCHWEKYETWSSSQHAKGFTGDFFQAQFYKSVLPSRSLDEKVAHVEEECIGCHSPSSFLSGDMIPEKRIPSDSRWKPSKEARTLADRGIFCDFCHTLDRFVNDPPFNHDYISHASEGIDPKRGDLEHPWSSHHETQMSELYENVPICATCHNEQNPYGVWVKALATGHKFPTGSVEERDVWLHVGLTNESGEEVLHIPVQANSDDPNDKYFITSNARVAYPSHSTLSEPIERDGLIEGDRLYHSAFLDSEGEFTYAQWLCVEEIENRLDPLEERLESYRFSTPENLEKGAYYLRAQMYYRRMPDPLADYFEINRRPVILVAKDERKLNLR